MSQDQQTYQRAVTGALLGLGVQIVIAVALLIMGLWSQNAAVVAATWQAFGGLALWIALAIIYQQHKLERIEALEAEQIAERHGSDSSLFETTAEDLSVHRRRLTLLYKWLLPIVSLITSFYLMGVGLWRFLPYLDVFAAEPDWPGAAVAVPRGLGLPIAVSVGLAFIGFLVSRYLAGMANVREWQLLRGGAGYVMASVIILLALIAGFGFAVWEVPAVIRSLAIIIPVFMVLIGIEMALNFLLDIYRPRRPNEIPRPAFDSRLLSLLTTPESIAKTINEAINYQFGFEITRSWFWQLLSRSFTWLVLCGAFLLWLTSLFVIVEPHQQAVMTRFGQIEQQPLAPGLHVKLPWPIARVRAFDVTKLRTIRVGDQPDLKPGVPILWSNEHLEGKPAMLIVALPKDLTLEGEGGEEKIVVQVDGDQAGDGDDQEAGIPSVSIVNAEVTLQYRIKEGGLVDYVRHYADADQMLGDLAVQEFNRYLLAHDVDELIGTGRAEASEVLRERIQAEVDRQQLGVQVEAMTVQSVHPPKEVAEAFHETVGAQQERQTAIEEARQEAIRRQVEVAGSVAQAAQLVDLIEQYNRLLRDRAIDDPEVDALGAKIEGLLREAGGEAATEIQDALAYRWERENLERSKAERFEKELLAYRAAPQFYKMRRYLEVLADSTVDARKYMLVADRDRLILRFDFKDVSGGFDTLDLGE